MARGPPFFLRPLPPPLYLAAGQRPCTGLEAVHLVHAHAVPGLRSLHTNHVHFFHLRGRNICTRNLDHHLFHLRGRKVCTRTLDHNHIHFHIDQSWTSQRHVGIVTLPTLPVPKSTLQPTLVEPALALTTSGDFRSIHGSTYVGSMKVWTVRMRKAAGGWGMLLYPHFSCHTCL